MLDLHIKRAVRREGRQAADHQPAAHRAGRSTIPGAARICRCGPATRRCALNELAAALQASKAAQVSSRPSEASERRAARAAAGRRSRRHVAPTRVPRPDIAAAVDLLARRQVAALHLRPGRGHGRARPAGRDRAEQPGDAAGAGRPAGLRRARGEQPGPARHGVAADSAARPPAGRRRGACATGWASCGACSRPPSRA